MQVRWAALVCIEHRTQIKWKAPVRSGLSGASSCLLGVCPGPLLSCPPLLSRRQPPLPPSSAPPPDTASPPPPAILADVLSPSRSPLTSPRETTPPARPNKSAEAPDLSAPRLSISAPRAHVNCPPPRLPIATSELSSPPPHFLRLSSYARCLAQPARGGQVQRHPRLSVPSFFSLSVRLCLTPPPARDTVPHLGLHSAASSGNLGLVTYALDHGQPVNSVVDGVLPLHVACSGGNDRIVRLLIERGADVNAPRYVIYPVFPFQRCCILVDIESGLLGFRWNMLGNVSENTVDYLVRNGFGSSPPFSTPFLSFFYAL